MVYLSGIGVVEGKGISQREQAVWRRVADDLPRVEVIADVFPYAADDRNLLQRATSWLWSSLARLRRVRRESLAPYLINLRNVLQVLVSADPRYGPTFNAGLALAIWDALLAHGYTPGSRVPVTLVGFSGGGQMALGASSMLSLLGAPVSVVSIGGVFSADPGFDHLQHFWDIRGSRDRSRLLGPLAFPGRWPITASSPWHRAVDEGRVTIVDGGPVVHEGRGGYFEGRRPGPDGVIPAERLTGILEHILSRPVPRTPLPPPAERGIERAHRRWALQRGRAEVDAAAPGSGADLPPTGSRDAG
ncbi:hypothetical protein G7070_08585 [Propioniciclava coleopterorum]|uniref:Alpha/beta hydrolase family protein n=1 Tax=Propioniciclava coleopterorum TaxID=2714937 RepID=A0A6G7Y6A3_9ACTN|nr:hypothetical protein [Propioniciclava coleopterorum]QIK72313.1 hypothetical protein G7070_08585 [Propioniciclava coleopterorum]